MLWRNDLIPNKVQRQFGGRKPLEVVVSDLTYLKCAGRWHYLCLLMDLHDRKIIGSAIGRQKDAKLAKRLFMVSKLTLEKSAFFIQTVVAGSKTKSLMRLLMPLVFLVACLIKVIPSTMPWLNPCTISLKLSLLLESPFMI